MRAANRTTTAPDAHGEIFKPKGIAGQLISIRPFRPADLDEVIELFRDAVQTTCARDYSPEQIKAWIAGGDKRDAWMKSLMLHYSLIATTDDGEIIGFGDIDTMHPYLIGFS